MSDFQTPYLVESAPPIDVPDHEVVGVLAARAGATVLETRFEGRRCATRIDEARAEARAELSVLEHVRHPGLAELVAHGVLADGRRFVTSAWVDGVALDAWSEGRDLEARVGVFVRVAEAIAHLHECGFVHGDIKAGNVLVPSSDQPVVIDLGFARSRVRSGGSEAAGLGSVGAIAPEVLRGGETSPRSDCFSLGVLLLALVRGRHPDPARLLARFPDAPYLEAAEVDPSEIPPAVRDLVEGLLDNSPSERLDAASVAWSLRARFGLDAANDAPSSLVAWSVARGREAWFADLIGRVKRAPDARLWIQAADEREAVEAWDHLCVESTLAGLATTRVDVGELARRVSDPLELDRAALELVEQPGQLVLVWQRAGDWSSSVLAWLARTASQARRGVLVVSPEAHPPRGDGAWSARPLPPVRGETLSRGLAALMPLESTAVLDSLAASIDAVARGSAPKVRSVLVAELAHGAIVAAETGLRAGPVSIGRARESSVAEAVSPLELRILTALWVRGPSNAKELGRFLSEERLDETCLALRRRGLLTLRGSRFELSNAGHARAVEASDAECRDLCRSRVRELIADGRREDAIELLWASEPESPSASRRSRLVARRLRRLRDAGRAPAVIARADRMEELAATSDQPLAPRIAMERALSWLALGHPDRALGQADAIEDADPCLASWLRGSVALHRNQTDQALEHFGRALELADAESVLGRQLEREERRARASIHFGRGDFAALRKVTVEQREHSRDPYLQSLLALSESRRGNTDAALLQLSELLAQAVESGDASREVALRIDIASLLRRKGSSPEALDELRRAEARAADTGHLPMLAHARALRGMVLRDQGSLVEAEEAIAGALALRQRAGDIPGAAVLRGTLGMTLYERGHLGRARAEIRSALRSLEGARRTQHTPLLSSYLALISARLGGPVEVHDVSEPRALLHFARACWIAADGRAVELASKARAASEAQGLAPVRDEADRLLGRLSGEPPAGDDDADIEALVARNESGALCSYAERMATVGRDDRAARAYFAAASRCAGAESSRELRSRATERLERCAAGLEAGERTALRRSLLARPDPWPEDLDEPADLEDGDVRRILEINRLLVDPTELSDLFSTIVDCAVETTGAERGFLVVEREHDLHFEAARDARRSPIHDPDPEVSRTIVGQALESMKVLRLSNAIDRPELQHAVSVAELELRSVLCAPLVTEGLRAAIYLDHRVRTGAFGERAEELLLHLAGQATLALRQAQRVEEIRELNQRLQLRVVEQEADLRVARRALREASMAEPLGAIVGESAGIRSVRTLIARAAPTQIPVVVSGPSGTGKELAARALHALSERSDGPLVVENCAAIPEGLMESELFGSVKGAFTGAERDRAGVFERAHRGTLFLDEIGELPSDVQAKLLRVLESGELRRVGGSEPIHADFRLVAATNRDLAAEVAAGRFREDLFYRLRGIEVRMPPLDERPEDIPLLVERFLAFEEARGAGATRFSPAVVAALSRRRWPGNVRELRNEISRLCVMSPGLVDDASLVDHATPASTSTVIVGAPATRTLADVEREAILATLEAVGGNKRKAAQVLGIARATLYERLKKFDADGSA